MAFGLVGYLVLRMKLNSILNYQDLPETGHRSVSLEANGAEQFLLSIRPLRCGLMDPFRASNICRMTLFMGGMKVWLLANWHT